MKRHAEEISDVQEIAAARLAPKCCQCGAELPGFRGTREDAWEALCGDCHLLELIRFDNEAYGPEE